MEPSVGGVCVLFFAEFAHFKILHCGVLSVIGQLSDCCVAGAAVGACDEEVVVSWVCWVAEFF